MLHLEEKPETLHVYVVREEPHPPQLFPVFFSALALALLIILCLFSSYQQPDIQKTIRVPAMLLPVQSFRTTAAIIPTGSKTYPATTAHGTLTITNGSIIASELPKGLLLLTNTGTQIVIDSRTYIPPGSAAGFGATTVLAHALVSGRNGNIPAHAINQVEGTSIYIRNVEPFTGGRDASVVKVITSQDEQTARNQARTILLHALSGKLMLHPCQEFVMRTGRSIGVSWTCQFATYTLPAYMQVTRARVEGEHLLIDVVYPSRSTRIGEKV
jgi:hypothetical protein